MITLPSTPKPSMGKPKLIDFGFFQRPATGGAVTRIDRAGMRHQVEVTFPPMPADTARVFVSRLERAKSEGLRLPFLLMGVGQGSPGAPVVNGSGVAGTSLPVRGLTSGYLAKEGFWLSVVDTAGQYYLHSIAADVTASGGGTATLTIWPPLRAPLADGNTIVLDAPLIEGIIASDIDWPQPVTQAVDIAFTLEEAA